MMRFGTEICRNLELAKEREWLETNALGGYASSTIAGLNTRRYHGLLVAALSPPRDRKVLLSKLEETLIVDGVRHELSTNQYPGTVAPAGYLAQSTFRLDPFPVFTWLIGELELHKTVFLVDGENTVVVQYLLRAQGSSMRANCQLELKPLVAFRDFHQTTHANSSLDRAFAASPGLISERPYPDLPELHFAHDAESVTGTGDWYYNFEYERERERGLDFHEDLFQPFTLHFDLSQRIQATVIASLTQHSAADAGNLRNAEVSRRKTLESPPASQFLTRKSVIAGYHWFDDWGRDTMIALPGLTAGRPEHARDILLAFAGHINQGMLPNRFDEAGGAPEYNTVDATLWYFEAIRSWLEVTGDLAFVHDHLYKGLSEIISHHQSGTRYGIRLEEDGLLHAGEPGVQLTWMDAKVGDRVITPRTGKPVEIQALWYNALRIMDLLSGGLGPYAALAARCQASFQPAFWNETNRCLDDVAGDPTIRPNQIFAVALHYPVFEDAGLILNTVERELLTPFGLRTLSPRDSRYCGRYEGGPAERDAAYHQGTVWPWLLYWFIKARMRAGTSKQEARKWLEPLAAYAVGPGLGKIPEIFDGNWPHAPRGCIAQAWSTAEFLRALSLTE